MGALANIATAATPSAQDQYAEQTPNGGGDADNPGADPLDLNGDGKVTPEEVKKAAEKNAKNNKDSKDDEGPSGAAGAVGSGTPPPPPGTSVAAAATKGPLDNKTLLAAIGMIVALGAGGLVLRGRGPAISTDPAGVESPTPG